MDNQTLYIVTGLPFSGKTTLITQLIKKMNLQVVSVDEFLSKDQYIIEDMTQNDWNKVYSQAFEKLERMLQKGQSVVFDGGSLLKSERDCLKGIAKKLGVRSKLVYAKTNVNEIKKRVEENRRLKKRDDVEDKTLEKAIKMFEEPTGNEDAIIYHFSQDLNNWINKNITQTPISKK